jgi:hypothetical protein
MIDLGISHSPVTFKNRLKCFGSRYRHAGQRRIALTFIVSSKLEVDVSLPRPAFEIFGGGGLSRTGRPKRSQPLRALAPPPFPKRRLGATKRTTVFDD